MDKKTFIHTCDLHLHEGHPERLEVLRWLLTQAAERGAALLICGDLFDSDQQATVYRPRVREVFNEFQGVDVFVLPGNHDERSYSGGEDYGGAVRVLSGRNPTPPSPRTGREIVEYKGVELVGAPFVSDSNLAAALAGMPEMEGPAILMAHGTYFGRDSAFWQEVQERGMEYYPIYPRDIEDSPFSYIALGHFHSRFNLFEAGAAKACYPGTPSPVTRAETGVRHAALVTINPDSGEVDVKTLTVEVGPYYLEEKFALLPGLEENTFSAIDAFLNDNKSDRADVIILLSGVTRWTDAQINDRFDNMRTGYSDYYRNLELMNRATGYSELMENALVRDFVERLENNSNLDENIKRLGIALGLKAFAKAMARRR